MRTLVKTHHGSDQTRTTLVLPIALVAGFAPLLAVPAARAQSPSAMDVLRRTAAVYREKTGYAAIVDVQTVAGDHVREILENEFGAGAAFRTEQYITQSPIKVSDGTTEWTFDPGGASYVKSNPKPGDSRVGSLALLDQNVTEATLDDQEIYGSSGTEFKVFIVEVTRSAWPDSAPSNAQSAIYTIDQSTYQVLKTITYAPDVAEVAYYRFPEWREAAPQRIAGGNSKMFAPPDQAKQVLALPQPTSTSVLGRAAPDFSLKDTTGHTFDLTSYRGKVLVISFVGSWCTACGAQLPYLQQVYSGHDDSELFAFAIDVGDSDQLATDYDANATLSFPMLVGAEPDVSKNYFVADFPTTYVIGRDGRIVFKSTGTENPRGFLAAVNAAVAKKR